MPVRAFFARFSLLLTGAVALLLTLCLSSCQTLGYYSQAVGGQIGVWRAAEPIDELLGDEQTDPALRSRLELVSDIRSFAADELALPDDGSYRRYADLKRPYVVWNVFAAPAFSLEPVTWCFPVAGCVGYRGYFSEEGAQNFADGLRERGFDVYVGGVAAYSTLGWFDDAVLNTFIDYRDVRLAQLIFHELAHRVAYAPGDTTFNESFATTVELEGVRRWLMQSGRSEEMAAFELARSRQQQFVELVMRTQTRLQALYEEDISDEEMLERKVATYTALREEYAVLKQSWGGYTGYDNWFAGSLNNAKLGSVAAYNQLVPAFQRLLADSGGDLAVFYAEVAAMAKLPEDERRARLGETVPRQPELARGVSGAATLSLFSGGIRIVSGEPTGMGEV
jgi:predicted aminopeptidase